MTYYDVLGISSTADFRLVRAAYLEADARLTASGDIEGASYVRRAYAVLGDEGLRQDYDRMLLDQFRAQSAMTNASASAVAAPVVRRKKKRRNYGGTFALIIALCLGVPLVMLIVLGSAGFLGFGAVLFVLLSSGLLMDMVVNWKGDNPDNTTVQVMSIIFLILLLLPFVGLVIGLISAMAWAISIG